MLKASLQRWSITAACILVAVFTVGCAAQPAPYSTVASRYARYERYEPSVVQLARLRTAPNGTYTVADLDVVNYADHVTSILRTKFTNARFARYTSATAQVGLAAASGIAAAFSAGTTAVATLAFGSAAVPQLGDIFKANNRATVYQQAVAKIEAAQIAYLALYPTPRADELTADGKTLFENVIGNIHTVESAMAGAVPQLKEVKDAVTTSGKNKGDKVVGDG
jgi:hypothetical protein